MSSCLTPIRVSSDRSASTSSDVLIVQFELNGTKKNEQTSNKLNPYNKASSRIEPDKFRCEAKTDQNTNSPISFYTFPYGSTCGEVKMSRGFILNNHMINFHALSD